MALLDSKQLNPILTGSFTLSGSLITDSASTGSFGRLNVTGNSNLVGDLTLGGNIKIGDSTADAITITADLTSNLTPNSANTYDIGNSVKTWRYGYINQIVGTSVTTTGNVSGSATSTGSFGSLVVDDKVQGDLTIGNSLISNKGATFNAAQSSAHDFRALSANKNYMLYVDANKDKVGIGFQNPEGNQLSSSLHIAGDLTTDSHITGSGNINTTAGRVFEQGTSVIDHATAMAIVFGG